MSTLSKARAQAAKWGTLVGRASDLRLRVGELKTRGPSSELKKAEEDLRQAAKAAEAAKLAYDLSNCRALYLQAFPCTARPYEWTHQEIGYLLRKEIPSEREGDIKLRLWRVGLLSGVCVCDGSCKDRAREDALEQVRIRRKNRLQAVTAGVQRLLANEPPLYAIAGWDCQDQDSTESEV